MKVRTTVPFLILLVLPSAFLPPVQRTATDIRLKFHETLTPVWSSAQFVAANLFGGMDHFRELVTVYRDNQLLKDEVLGLRQELKTLRELQKENERLSELLDLKKAHPKNSLVGRIISRHISNWFRWVMIDVGKRDGIRERMVLVSDGGVVGRVLHVGDTVSECILLTDPDSGVSATLQTSRAVGLVNGEGTRDRLRMSLIPLDAQVEVGEEVITSGFGGVYPKGLPIGKVMTVGTDRDGMHLFAYVKPAVNFNTIEDVLCIDSSRRD